MHATIRSYTDPGLADLLASHKDEIEELLGAIPGVRSYVLVRTADGCASVTVGDDEAATSASADKAAGFLSSHGTTAPPPVVSTGDVIASVGVAIPA